jgi:hypothetical protein
LLIVNDPVARGTGKSAVAVLSPARLLRGQVGVVGLWAGLAGPTALSGVIRSREFDSHRYNPSDPFVALTPGMRLGPYAIVSALGAGGMGEVSACADVKHVGESSPSHCNDPNWDWRTFDLDRDLAKQTKWTTEYRMRPIPTSRNLRAAALTMP